MNDDQELPQEIQLLLRDVSQAAKTILNVGGSIKYGVDMLRIALRREAMERSGHNQCQAARILKEHRNNFALGMKQQERYRIVSKMPMQTQRAVRQVSAQAG